MRHVDGTASWCRARERGTTGMSRRVRLPRSDVLVRVAVSAIASRRVPRSRSTRRGRRSSRQHRRRRGPRQEQCQYPRCLPWRQDAQRPTRRPGVRAARTETLPACRPSLSCPSQRPRLSNLRAANEIHDQNDHEDQDDCANTDVHIKPFGTRPAGRHVCRYPRSDLLAPLRPGHGERMTGTRRIPRRE